MNISEQCPKCGDVKNTEWLSTTNEWEYYCPKCDIRFNKYGKIRPEDDPPDEWPPDTITTELPSYPSVEG